MPTKPQSAGIPENVLSLLSAADARKGFPAGTMQSVVQQEVGGNAGKYLDDPTAYHYGLNGVGQRVAGHTGKVSTAFGPFGILESTAADPGYGVKPLAHKGLDEQVRFAADYLAARSKAGDGLPAGLAGYGEGAQYAQQVLARTGGQPVVAAPAANPGPEVVAPPVTAQVQPGEAPQQVAQAPAVIPVHQADAWQAFLSTMPQQAQQPVNVADISYGNTEMATPVTRFQSQPMGNRRPNFEAFSSWRGRG